MVSLPSFEFKHFKSCSVPLIDGLFEYICAAAIIAYNFINAQTRIQTFISPTVRDVRNVSSYSSDVYSPVCYREKSMIYESLSDRK